MNFKVDRIVSYGRSKNKVNPVATAQVIVDGRTVHVWKVRGVWVDEFDRAYTL